MVGTTLNRAALETKEKVMKLYAFKCTVWVQGESAEDALKELHDEVDYHFSLDNNLVALESDEGTLVEQEEGESK